MSLPIPEGTVEAYEGLRRQAWQPDDGGAHLQSRSMLIRCGMAAWSQGRPAALPVTAAQWHVPPAVAAPVLDSWEAELVRSLAGLILSTRQEDFCNA